MKKAGLLIIMFILSAQIIRTVSAAPYHPPPPPPPPEPNEPPEPPPPEEGETPKTDEGPKDTPIPPTPTPTPCIPSFCFFLQTTCCFDTLCVFHGETEKGGNNRCLDIASEKDKTNPFPQAIQSTKSFFGMIISKISSFFGK